MKHGSLFSGVGGLDLGFDAAGIETLWQCEINAQCRSVLAKHWPDATRYTDVCEVKGDEVSPVDIISFGSPCQDLSIAGKREGFKDGTRSNLYFEAIRIIEEMRNATNNQYPRIAIWENVRGALSSNGGRDFLAAIQALADLGAVDISWRVVNTCHFGPPQRRVRVFVVADFGGECAGEVLAQPTRVLWHPTSSKKEGQEPTGEVAGSVRGGRKIANCLSAELYHHGTVVNQDANNGHVVVEAQPYDKYNDALGDRVHHALRAGTKQSTGVVEPYRATSYGQCVEGVGTLRAKGGDINGGSETILIEPEQVSYRVRRLTPRECEQLQGWPDDHTRWADTGKEISDSARYKMCGNGISAPVAQWIGENIVHALTND